MRHSTPLLLSVLVPHPCLAQDIPVSFSMPVAEPLKIIGAILAVILGVFYLMKILRRYRNASEEKDVGKVTINNLQE